MQSVRRADPTSRLVVVSDDEAVPMCIDHEAESYFRIPGGEEIMVANIDAQITALLSGDDEFVFLDTDVLLLKPIPLLGELTVTWRDHALVGDDGEKIGEGLAAAMPYNYGVMRAKCTKATVEAFIWLRERVRKMHTQQQKWYGNQLAMHELAGPRPVTGNQIDVRRIPWQLARPSTFVNVGKIPCETYNYTPPNPPGLVELENKHALHFKGQSRPLMEGYAKALGLGWYL
jgi:hypothetical protein